MAHGVDHAAQRLGVRPLNRLADAAQAERAQRVALAPVGAVGGLDLGDQKRAHATGSSAGVSTAASAWITSTGSSSTGVLDRPRTLSTERPRSCAISSGLRRSWRPAMVALTRLMGFWEPSDFERMSWMPASSSTARTPPPAMTPVPGEAGLRKTRPEPKIPVV